MIPPVSIWTEVMSKKSDEGVPLVNNAYRAPQSLKASYAEKSSECWL